jgi:antitoxin Phd
MKVYSFSEARQQFSSVLDSAKRDGCVRITRRDGQVFLIKPLESEGSPLAVQGVDIGITQVELLDFIHESRRY